MEKIYSLNADFLETLLSEPPLGAKIYNSPPDESKVYFIADSIYKSNIKEIIPQKSPKELIGIMDELMYLGDIYTKINSGLETINNIIDGKMPEIPEETLSTLVSLKGIDSIDNLPSRDSFDPMAIEIIKYLDEQLKKEKQPNTFYFPIVEQLIRETVYKWSEHQFIEAARQLNEESIYKNIQSVLSNHIFGDKTVFDEDFNKHTHYVAKNTYKNIIEESMPEKTQEDIIKVTKELIKLRTQPNYSKEGISNFTKQIDEEIIKLSNIEDNDLFLYGNVVNQLITRMVYDWGKNQFIESAKK
ncbi:MAG: hypothetical protein KAT91_03980 [Candidatus Aenigmarchaeota archaeon]|nr:hypothetical protein [Candidatus Aenigmarchaeota archaeon]